jgi:membrane associated rhomboid family serine protease
MLPLMDENPTRGRPYFTYLIIAVNIVIFLLQLTYSPRQLENMYYEQALVPAFVTRDLLSVETLLDFLRSMFFHGGWLHLISNMLYLWIFGDNIEDRFGRILYLVLYFASGFAAGFAQIAIAPDSEVPMIGASGAIAGVLGAYALMFPSASVRGLLFFGFFARMIELPALVVLGFWFVTQLFNGVASLGVDMIGGGVAFFAHIGGFVAGLLLARVFLFFKPPPPVDRREEWLARRYDRF